MAKKPAAKSKAVAVHKKTASKAVAVATPRAPRTMLEIIAEASTNKHVDVAKMQALLAMQREIMHDNERREFNKALLAAQGEMPPIVKDAENDHTKKRYATLEVVSKTIDKIARAHGFSMSFGTENSPLAGHYRIICDLSHTAGQTRRYQVDLQSDDVGAKGNSNKTPIQAVGSTMSYGRRYLKLMIFDIVPVNEDTDGSQSTDFITAKQVATLRDVIKFKDAEEEKVCAYAAKRAGCDVTKLEEIPARVYERTLTALQNYSPDQPKK